MNKKNDAVRDTTKLFFSDIFKQIVQYVRAESEKKLGQIPMKTQVPLPQTLHVFLLKNVENLPENQNKLKHFTCGSGGLPSL